MAVHLCIADKRVTADNKVKAEPAPKVQEIRPGIQIVVSAGMVIDECEHLFRRRG